MIFPHCVRWERFSSSGSQTGRATNHIPTSWRSVSWQGSWPLSISRPLGFFLCQIWTIIRPPGLLEPHLLISTQIFSLTTQPSTIVLFLIEQSLSKSICGHFCGNFFWQRLLSSSPQIRLLFVQKPLTTQLQLLRLQSPNRNVSFLLHKNRQHATESWRKIIDISKQNVFTRSLIPACNGNAFNGW